MPQSRMSYATARVRWKFDGTDAEVAKRVRHTDKKGPRRLNKAAMLHFVAAIHRLNQPAEPPADEDPDDWYKPRLWENVRVWFHPRCSDGSTP